MSATYILKEVGDSPSPCVQRRRLAEISGCPLPRLTITVTWRALKMLESHFQSHFLNCSGAGPGDWHCTRR